MTCKFFEMLQARWNAGARVCVGLDSDPDKLPHPYKHATGYGLVDLFNSKIIDQTRDLALAYKPNIAFYSGKYSPDSLTVLCHTIGYIREHAPGVPVILDAKRGDIGNTNRGYVEEAFTSFGADAVTVHHYLGKEAMQPFLDQKNKGIIVLCKTSNSGSAEMQDVNVTVPHARGHADMPYYQFVARRVAEHWNENGNCALVVGATYPNQLGEVRKIVGDMWILVPGVGTQGGDVDAVIEKGLNSKNSGLIINSSSGIIFNKDPRQATIDLTASIDNAIRRRIHAPVS